MAARHSKGEGTVLRRHPAVNDDLSYTLGLASMAFSIALGLALATLSHSYSDRMDPSLYGGMTETSVGAVLVLLTLALGARFCFEARDLATAVCALCGVGVAAVGVWTLWLGVSGALWALQPAAQMPLHLLPAATVLSTGLAVAGLCLAPRACWPTAILTGNCIVSGGFTFVWLLHWADNSPGDLARLFPSLPAMIMGACNLGFLLAEIEQPVRRPNSAAPPSASLPVWRIFTCSIAALMTIGVMRTLLQTYGLVNLEEGTALMVLSAIAVMGAMLSRSARLLNEAWKAEECRLLSLQMEVGERQALVQQAEMKREQLAAVLRAAADYAIIATDLSGKVIIFNEGASRMTGYSSEEIVNSDAIMWICDPEEVAARARELHVPPGFDVFSTVPNRGETDARQWSYVQKDGSRLQVWLSVTALRDRNNAICGYAGIARDISAEVRHKREREGLLNIGQELLCLADPQGCLKITSPSFLRTTGYRPQDLVGQSLIDFVHPDDRSAAQRVLGQLMTGGGVQHLESRWRTWDGAYRVISWDLSPPEEDGLMFASGWDVTEEKVRQQELERFLEFEKHLIGIVSHDLRNPIAATSLAAQAISRQEDASDRIRVYARRIHLASERATRMIHDLLDFTQARLGGGIQVAKHALDLAPAIGQILDELRLAHPQSRIVLECPEHLMLDGDADRLAQALSNIVGNSLKYGSPTEPVVVSTRLSGDGVALAVYNGGTPIPPEVIPTLFLPLSRGASGKSNGSHSIGLGLYIASEIARAHGGYIDVQSSAEAGTDFTIHLPVDHAQERPNAEVPAPSVPAIATLCEKEASVS